jgi:hypothetical protein
MPPEYTPAIETNLLLSFKNPLGYQGKHTVNLIPTTPDGEQMRSSYPEMKMTFLVVSRSG